MFSPFASRGDMHNPLVFNACSGAVEQPDPAGARIGGIR